MVGSGDPEVLGGIAHVCVAPTDAACGAQQHSSPPHSCAQMHAAFVAALPGATRGNLSSKMPGPAINWAFPGSLKVNFGGFSTWPQLTGVITGQIVWAAWSRSAHKSIALIRAVLL